MKIANAVLLSIFLLSQSTALLAQGQSNNQGNGNTNRLTGLERKAEVQQRNADRHLAEGKQLLRRMGNQASPQLHERQRLAEQALQARKQKLTQDLQQARSANTESSYHLVEADLAQTPLIDSELRLAEAVSLPLAPLQSGSGSRLDPSPNDLQATLDAPQTTAIVDLANSLNKDPVAIHEWVRKHIEFVPSRGSLQGAAGALASGRGNATDTASLLIALLRASNVHARYVQGQIEVPAAAMQRWLAVDSIEAVQELLMEGGLPFAVVNDGGVVSALRLEHVWVEAWIDMVPSRGAKHREGDSWVALDASFKSLDRVNGTALSTLLALDLPSITSAIQAASTIDSAQGSISGFDRDALSPLLEDLDDRFASQLQNQNPAPQSIVQLLSRIEDRTPNYPMFAGDVPFKVMVAGTPQVSLSDTDRHHYQLQVARINNGVAGPNLLQWTQPTVALVGQRLDLSFGPAGIDDVAALQALLPSRLDAITELPSSIPAYLVQMTGALTFGDTSVASLPALGMGERLQMQIQVRRPDGLSSTQHIQTVVGSNRALVQDWQGGAFAELETTVSALKRAQSGVAQGENGHAKRLANLSLTAAGLSHFATSNSYQNILAGVMRNRFHRQASSSSAFLGLDVHAPLGLLLAVEPYGYGLSDVSPLHSSAALQRNSARPGDEPSFARQSLAAQSLFGARLLESLFQGGGRSATKVFATVLSNPVIDNQTNQQAVHSFDAEQPSTLQALGLPSDLQTQLQGALAAQDRVSVNAKSQPMNNWRGYGARQLFAAGRGGSSFVYGQSREELNPVQTGAQVNALSARAEALCAWLDDGAPRALQVLCAGQLDGVVAAGEGLVVLSRDPASLAINDDWRRVLLVSTLDEAIAPRVAAVLEDHLFPELLRDPPIASLLDSTAPTVSLSASPNPIVLGASSTISASVADNKPGASLSLTADGLPLTLINGQVQYTPSRAGVVLIVARGIDAAGNTSTQSLELRISSPADLGAPVVSIHSPIDNAAVTTITDVMISATDESLVKWRLMMREGNSPNQTPIVLGESTQAINNAKGGQVDPTMMFNGVYVLILEAEDAGGRKSTDSVQIRVEGDLKLGHFSISFVDAEVPLYGIPIRITRTYDTRQSKQSLDFGYGWSVDYQNVRLRESRKLGFSWTLQQQGGALSQWCVKPTGNPIVTVTLPDGESEQFRARFEPECTAYVPTPYGELYFEPLNPRTQSTLVQMNYGILRWANVAGQGSNLIDLGSEDMAAVDPNLYVMTTSDGMKYVLDQNFGVRQIRDQAGNLITYTHDGIVHSSGVSINFIRDTQDRITDVVLPDGRRIKYRYNESGDLLGMTDQNGHETSFSYLPNVRYPHYLQDIIDARGVRVARNEYDDDGRLIATVDANGQRQEYVHDIAGNVERVKDRLGRETVYIYDDNGWVLSQTNALGEQTVWTYDANGNETSKTDALNRKTEFTVDVRGNALQEKDPMGAITTRTFGTFNQLKTEVDHLNRPVVTNAYATNLLSGVETSYIASSTDALGNRTFFHPDICGTTCPNTGNMEGITDALGAFTDFQYDLYGNLQGEVDAAGDRTARTFDAMGRVLTETKTRSINGVTENLITAHVYDGKGNLTQTTHPDGSITRNSYNAIDKLITSTDALGRITQYEYDNTGRQTKVIYPDGAFEQTEFDAEGNEIAKTDRAGRTTRMQYDAANRLVKTIYPDDTPSNALDNPFTESVYDAAGQLKISRNERGHETHYGYDNAGRQTTITDALGKTTTHQYDLTGRRLSTTDALGRTIKFEYDLAGKLVATIYPDATSDDGNDANNPRTQIAYDVVGRKQSETDEMGRKTEFKYDSLGRLTEVWLAAHTATPIKTKYAYDEQGNKLTQTDALNRVTAWAYDKNGRNVERKLPLGQVESFDYNAAGERIKHTTFNNAVMNYAYDNLGRIDTITFPDATTRKFTYNTAGQVASINDKGAVYAFAYDARDRLIQANDSNNRKIDYGYDIAGNRVELKTPSSTIGFEYDELNRLSKVVANLVGQAANQTTQYQYDDVGNRIGQTNPNKSTVSYSYDRRNRLSNLAHKTAAGVLMLGMAYTVDASGLRTSINETGAQASQTRSAAYTYDAMKRLTVSVVTGTTAAKNLTETFAYDNVGNRLTRRCQGKIATCTAGRNNTDTNVDLTTTYTYDNNDRLLTEVDGYGAYKYEYDNAGNFLTKKQNTTNGVTYASYAWDAENRMTQATLVPSGNPNVGTVTTTKYLYDPNGIRRSSEVMAKVVGTTPSVTKTVTNFLIDPNQSYAQVLEDWTSKATIAGSVEPTTLPDASLQNSYVYGDDLIAELRYAAMPNSTGTGSVAVGDGGNDTLARIGALSGESVYHYDGLGSTRLLSALNLDASGNPVTTGTAQNPANETVTDSYAYTAFGETDFASTTGTTENNYRFTGEQLDPNLGWYYLRARYMNPTQGRFIGMDSWMGNSSDPITLHKYLYANANSVMYTDPSGNMTLGQVITVTNWVGNIQTVATIGVNVLTGNYTVAAGQIAEEVVYSKLGALGRPIANLGKRGLALFYRVFGRSVKLKLGLRASGKTLEDNLVAVGVSKPGGSVQAHHIVAGTDETAQAARDVLERHSIDINSPTNGVFLPGCGSTNAIGAVHCGSHFKKYIEDVNNRILEADARGDKIAVLNALGEIKMELLAGVMELNRKGSL